MSEFLNPTDIKSALKTPLPGKYYTSSTIFQEELEKIFFNRWINLGRSEQIPQPGDYFLYNLGVENLIVVRDTEGTIRAHFNICRHRGTQLCQTETGNLGRSIRCPYHAWTFGLDGELIGAPLMQEIEDFRRADYPLFSVAVEIWEGFIFVNFSPNPQPFVQEFAPLINRFDSWQISELRSVQTIEYDVQANWKFIIENYSECYHCPSIHPQLMKLTYYRSGRNDLFEGMFLGGYMQMNHGIDSMTMSGEACNTPLGQISGEDLSRVYFYSIFPNMLLSLHPDYVMVHTLKPLAPDRTLIQCQWLFDPATAPLDFKAEDAVEFWHTTNRQDWEVCELSQIGVSSRAYQPGPYSTPEILLAMFDQTLLEALGHSLPDE